MTDRPRVKRALAYFDDMKPGETLALDKTVVITSADDPADVSTHKVVASIKHGPQPEWFSITFDGPLPRPLARAMLELLATHGAGEVN